MSIAAVILHSIGCGNITSFFIMPGNLAVEVVAEWTWFHLIGPFLKFSRKYSQSLSCVGVVRSVRLSLKPTFRTFSGAPHFNKGRFRVASPFPRFVPLWFLFMGIFEIPCLCQPPEKPTRLEGQHPRRNWQLPADTLVRVMANTRNRYMQCMDNGGRHLPDMIFKTVWNKTFKMYYQYKTTLKPFWFLHLVLLPFGKRKLCCRTLYMVRIWCN